MYLGRYVSPWDGRVVTEESGVMDNGQEYAVTENKLRAKQTGGGRQTD